MPEAPTYVAVLPDLAADSVERLFHYAVPEGLSTAVKRGQLVEIPFGHRSVRGFVISFVDEPEVTSVKPIGDIIDPEPVLDQHLLALAEWISEYYLCHLVQALRAIIPPGLRKTSGAKVVEVLSLTAPNQASEVAEGIESRAPKQAEVLRYLITNTPEQPLTRTQLARAVEVSLSVVRALIDKGHLEVRRKRVYRNPFGSSPVSLSTPPEPTAAQADALRAVERTMEGREAQALLLHGVTGSGKTEVYMRTLEQVRGRGQGGIVLVPEISLTPQILNRFRSRFPGRVAVLHSALSTGERYDQWLRIKNGEADVVVGARSAVFAPVPKLGMIIVDEEHENTYKQSDVPPRYDAREVALERASEGGAAVMLGSATPSLESYHRASSGEYELLNLPQRIDGRPLPPVKVVDMRDELKAGNRSVFSRELEQALAEVLRRGEQALLFLNRRGYSTFVMCRECGHAVRCTECDITMTYHFSDDRIRCHYCNRSSSPPELCPSCGSRYIRYFGTGTQRIEEAAQRLFPQAKVARMDMDTTGRKGAHERLYNMFRSGRIDILIGTQMIAKGWDIPNVTIVGVVAADTVLRLPDFRSAERTFQLLTQVAGRTGRGSKGGRVVVQTYDPDHYAIRAAAEHDYDAFYEQESEERRLLSYPPFGQLVRLVLEAEDEQLVAAAAGELDNILRGEAEQLSAPLKIMGPAPAPLSRLRSRFRWHLVVQGPRSRSAAGQMHQVLMRSREAFSAAAPSGIVLHIDVDPASLL